LLLPETPPCGRRWDPTSRAQLPASRAYRQPRRPDRLDLGTWNAFSHRHICLDSWVPAHGELGGVPS
jgi:hypothetical protein